MWRCWAGVKEKNGSLQNCERIESIVKCLNGAKQHMTHMHIRRFHGMSLQCVFFFMFFFFCVVIFPAMKEKNSTWSCTLRMHQLTGQHNNHDDNQNPMHG